MTETALQPYSYILSRKLKTMIEGTDPDLDLLSDLEITEQAAPTAMMWELRARLWILIDARENDLRKFGKCDPLKVDEIRKGICSEKQFNRYLSNPMQAAFLARPLGSPENRQEDLARAAHARLWEILSLPLTDKDGRPDKALAKLVFDTSRMVIEHKYGTAIQRSETLARVQTQTIKEEPINVKALEDDIRKLHDRTEHAGSTIEITGEEET